MIELHPGHIGHLERDLAYLCGQEAAGRLSGTKGARMAAEYLAAELQAAGYQPAGYQPSGFEPARHKSAGYQPAGYKSAGYRPPGSDGYFQPVDVLAARLTGPAHLCVAGRELRHQVDYAEMTTFSAGASCSGPLVVARDGEDLDPS